MIASMETTIQVRALSIDNLTTLTVSHTRAYIKGLIS